jgi:hypothetical protein
MLKEKLRIINNYVSCESANCKFRSECAIHYSAGDFRSEDGFTPRMFREKGVFYCSTINSSDHKSARCVPAEVDKLGRGGIIELERLKEELDVEEFILNIEEEFESKQILSVTSRDELLIRIYKKLMEK